MSELLGADGSSEQGHVCEAKESDGCSNTAQSEGSG